jgi:hypothetical protein
MSAELGKYLKLADKVANDIKKTKKRYSNSSDIKKTVIKFHDLVGEKLSFLEAQKVLQQFVNSLKTLDIDEMSGSGGAGAYMTPNAFSSTTSDTIAQMGGMKVVGKKDRATSKGRPVGVSDSVDAKNSTLMVRRDLTEMIERIVKKVLSEDIKRFTKNIDIPADKWKQLKSMVSRNGQLGTKENGFEISVDNLTASGEWLDNINRFYIK